MFTVLLFIGGLVIGSFIGALTYRLPRNQGFVKGRSYCDSCKKELLWFDNIPLFSYLLYAGKSRCCKKKISIRYPLIELFSALGAVVLYLLFGVSVFPIYYILYTISLAIFVIDLEHQVIPDELSWLILLLGLYATYDILYTSLFVGFFFSFLLLLLNLVTKGRGMGLGDVKLAIALGSWLTLASGFKWLLVSFVLGGIVASILLLSKKAELKTRIAFGPFLILAFWTIVIYEKFF